MLMFECECIGFVQTFIFFSHLNLKLKAFIQRALFYYPSYMLSENSTSPGTTRKKRSPSFISLESDKKFKEVVLEDTSEAIKTAEKIPETVVGKIDFHSTIVESLGKY